MMPREWTGSAKTAEEAVQKGLKQLGLTRDQADVEVLGEKRSGLFSLFGFKRIEVTVTAKPGALRENLDEEIYDRRPRDRGERFERGRDRRGGRGREDRRDDRPRDRNGREESRGGRPRAGGGGGRDERSGSGGRPPRDNGDKGRNRDERPKGGERRDRGGNRPPERREAPAEAAPRPAREIPAAEALLAEWKSLLGWDDLSWKSGEEGTIVFDTASGTRLMESNGAPLGSLEHLLNTVRIRGDNAVPRVTLRMEGAVPPSDRKIVDEALHAAYEVKQTGRPYRLDPMPPQERRLVHQTLADHPDVETVSEGDGPFRKVVVRPKSRSGR